MSDIRTRALGSLQVYLHGIESDISTLLSCTENKRGVYNEGTSSEAYTRASQFVTESQALYLKLSSMFNLVRETPTIEKTIQEGYIYLQKQQERLQLLLESYGIEDSSSNEYDGYENRRSTTRQSTSTGETSRRFITNRSTNSRSSLEEWEAPTLEQIGLSETSLEALKTLNVASPNHKTRSNTPTTSSSNRKTTPDFSESSRYLSSPCSTKDGKVRVLESEFEKHVAPFVKHSVSVSELSEKLHLLHQASSNRNSKRFSQSELSKIFQASSSKLKLYCLALVQLKYLRIEGDDLVLVEDK
ncbi:hypothetical protein GAYE_SCF56G6348 [Galdieria yellowstonensis]|uniref:Spindle and kinetochore-associated protein 3 n=1 Tax=Galdieria yellowstonensis TaxID=3028027 RepID=A0AAV9IMN4_9RHOD|nr:hypothetical protein GAYE_SCF56G6348 [Galdieria yellowstonensis]